MNITSGMDGRALRLAVLGLATAALAGCSGGGGGGSNVRADPPPAAPPPVVSTPNPAYSKHLVVTNAAPAAAVGLTGSGVTVGVVDSGVNRTHPALSPRVVANLEYIDDSRNNLNVDDVVGHGTAVTQIMAGTPFGAWPGGVAPGVRIVSARIISDTPPEDDGSGQGNEIDGPVGLKPIHQDLIDRGARIMNNSWGGLYWTNANATAPIADEYRPFIIGNGGLVVFATGNSSFPDPSSMAALPSQPGPNGSMPAADLERGWIAVTALDTDNPTQIAGYANHCGVAMRYCMAAPGSVVVTGTDDAPDNPSYFRWTGTSLAAPLVSGAAALVWQRFPYFSNDLLRQTLLGTAKDLGDPGVDPVFGYGGLDIGHAIRGPAKFDWGDVTVNFSGTSTWANTITGSGGLVKQGAGTLKLTGPSRYTGTTRVQGGVLEVASSLGGAASVASAGTLRLRRGVNGGLTNNGAVELLGDARNTSINGNYTQSASARLLFLVGAPLHVRGTALLNGELQITGIASGYVRNDRETVVQAAGGLSGTFASLTNGPGVFLEATLGYDSNNAWLDITRLDVSATAQAMGFSPMALSSAQRVEGTFDAIDNGAPTDDPSFDDRWGSFAAGAGALQRSATAAAAERALSSLSGEVQGADGLFATMAIEGGRRAVEARVDARGDRFAGGGAWAEADGFQRQAMGRLAVDGHGWTMGQDLRLANGLTVGAAFGQTDALAWLGGTRDHDRARLTDGQVYAAWESGDHYLFGRYAYGRIDRHVQRDLLLGDARFASLSDQVSRYSAFELQAGRHFEVAGTRFTPYAGVHAMQLERDAYAEDEAVGFGLQADDSTARATQSALGLRLARDWSLGGVRVGLSGRAEWLRTLSQSGTDIDARFNAIDVWSPIPGQPLSSDAAIFGFGLEALFPRLGRWRFGVDQRREGGRDWMQTRLDWRFGF